VFGGGGGVIVPAEIRELQDYGVARIYSPEDGQRMGLAGMIGEMVMRCDQDLTRLRAGRARKAIQGHGEMNWRALAQLITALENGKRRRALVQGAHASRHQRKIPVLGITGTGGAGKSSLTDELIRRLRLDQDDSCAWPIISIDPSRRKSGGALLGDRIRMNAIWTPWPQRPRVFMRSLATRDFGSEISAALPDVIAACKAPASTWSSSRPRHRPGRRRHRAARGRAHVRDDARVRRRQPARKDRHAGLRRVRGHQQVRPQGFADALRDVAKQVQRNKEAWGKRPTKCRCSAPWPRASTTTA
jgi:methylmalonyl-CoA mutase